MVGKKKLTLILSGILIVAGLVSCAKTSSSNENEKTRDVSKNSNEVKEMYTIGINQLTRYAPQFIRGEVDKGFFGRLNTRLIDVSN